MRTRSNFYPSNSTANIPRRSNRRRISNIVEPEIRAIAKIIPMDDRTMEELLQAPTEGDVPNDAIKLMLFPYSLEDKARIWYEKEPPNLILTWDDLVNKFVNQFFPPSKTTHLKNEISRFTQRFKETFSKAWDRFKELLRACPHHGFSELTQIDTFYNGLTEQDHDSLNAASGGAHAYYECIVTDSNPSSVCAATGSYNQVSPRNRASHQIPPPGFATVQNNPNRFNQSQGNYLNQINVLRGDFSKQEENLRRNLNDDMRNILSSFFQNQPLTSGTLPSNTIPNPKGKMKAVTTTTESPLEKVDEQITEEILDKEHSNSSRSIAQVQPPVVPISIPEPDVLRTKKTYNSSLLANKDKLFELAKVPLNENYSVMLLKKLPEKLGDPGKFLIPCDFPGMEVCHALADLGASINIMPLSIWKKLSLQELTPTRMTLELADRSITRPKGVAEDVFVKVGKFHFLTDFIVVEFEADPRVPLILGRVDVIDVACEDFVQDVLDFQYNPKSSSPTLVSDDLIFENDAKIEDFLNDDTIPIEVKNSVYDPEGDILFIEKMLNEDPFSLPLMDLKIVKESKEKYSVEEPPELELKELPSHIEYAFLEDSNKVLVIIAKNLKVDEREALINVLKSYKWAIAWKISNIKGINPRFCTHKILMEDDYKPVVQSQRRVNPKIYDVIKKEVIKLLDAGMIYPISDSPWVSSIHCVPQKGGMTVVANENNELILTRLVTGWRVCIDYRKLNDATRKDHSPLPFMDQMLERLAGNEFYCFLDGFSGYFQIPIDPQDQEKTTFTCPYGTFAYRCMPFGLCNAPGIFQRCMMFIFQDMNEKTMEVFMDDFSVFGNSFSSCLTNLDKMLNCCEETNLVLNWEKCHFMCREGIVLGHKISKSGIEVDRAKVDVIAKLPHPTTVKGVRSFLGHAGFYCRFIQDFLKIARPMTHLFEKKTPFVFSKKC
nr:DNA-directed DNA polymerase [Tanacetum cinerariifolium]